MDTRNLDARRGEGNIYGPAWNRLGFVHWTPHRLTSLQYWSFSMTLTVEIKGISTTGSGLNSARSLGPLGKFVPYHGIYWLGPLLGTISCSGVPQAAQVSPL